jgi:hypothetical protein
MMILRILCIRFVPIGENGLLVILIVDFDVF